MRRFALCYALLPIALCVSLVLFIVVNNYTSGSAHISGVIARIMRPQQTPRNNTLEESEFVTFVTEIQPQLASGENSTTSTLRSTIQNLQFNFQDVWALLQREDRNLGQTRAARKCSEEFGVDMIERWKTTRLDICSGYRNQSHITCLRREPYQKNRFLCTATESMVRMHTPLYEIHADVSNQAPPYRENMGFDFRDGILQVNCDLGLYQLVPKEWWDDNGLKLFMKSINVDKNMECTHYVNHTVFWMLRYDPKNLFHFMEDVVTTFQSLLVLGQDPQMIEIAVYDTYPLERYQLFDIWSKIFGRGVRIVRDNPYPVGTCFKNSIFSIYADSSHFSHNGAVGKFVKCQSPILRTMLPWIKSMFGVVQPQDLATKSAKLSGKILWVSRRNYDGRTISRVIPNEAEIIEYIRKRLPPSWTLEVFRPELMLSIEEQVRLVSTARVLIGVHGAGLANLMFMPNEPESHVIEIFHSDRSSANRHYINICKWLNMTHHDAGYYSSAVPPENIWPIVESIVHQEEK